MFFDIPNFGRKSLEEIKQLFRCLNLLRGNKDTRTGKFKCRRRWCRNDAVNGRQNHFCYSDQHLHFVEQQLNVARSAAF